jgi:hypothetical protein
MAFDYLPSVFGAVPMQYRYSALRKYIRSPWKNGPPHIAKTVGKRSLSPPYYCR